MKKLTTFLVLSVAACLQSQAQQREGNPFARLGYKADVYTFGDKKEFHDQEEIVEIGDVLFNTKTNEVVGFVEDTADSLIKLKPELQSMSIDPHCEKYYSVSPYAYCLNNPVNAIDPDGKIVIFINGMHNGSGGKNDYWVGFDLAVMKYLNDFNRIYRDGSVGGTKELPLNLSANNRKGYGFQQGKSDIPNLLKSIMDGNGNFKETIKIISHSMGGAYAKGYVQALVEYFVENGIPLDLIEFEADFAPFQPTEQKAVAGIKTLQFSNLHDNVAGNRYSPFGIIDGVDGIFINSNKDKGHSIIDFYDQIKNLPSGKYKFVNGEIVPY